MAAYIGTVTSFNFGKSGDAGYGFISCGKVPGDVYFQRKDLPEELKNFGYNGILKGKTVSFALTHTPEGKPQGKNVRLVPSEGEPLIGVIRSYSQTNRYGFITSNHTSEDCYFQQKELPPSMQAVDGKRLMGQTVQFEVLLKPDGKPWATNLKLHKMIMAAGQKGGSPPQANAYMVGMSNSTPAAGGAGKRPSSVPNTFGPTAVKRPRVVSAPGKGKGKGKSGQSFGMVLSFNLAKGFGFISGDAASGGDVFFSRDSLVPGTPHELQGRGVMYDLTFSTTNGKPQAQNVSAA